MTAPVARDRLAALLRDAMNAASDPYVRFDLNDGRVAADRLLAASVLPPDTLDHWRDLLREGLRAIPADTPWAIQTRAALEAASGTPEPPPDWNPMPTGRSYRGRAVPPPAAPGLREAAALAGALDATGDELGRQVAKSEVYRLGLADAAANLRRHETALGGLILAIRGEDRVCRLCGAVESQVHLPDCPVSEAVRITHPEYVRALAETPGEPAHPRSCSSWFASDATTGEGICDCGLVAP